VSDTTIPSTPPRRLADPPTLHLIVGLPGAGKTTLARQLELDIPAFRLTPDEWIETLYGASVKADVLDAARDPVERLQWDVAVRALELGVDVILDFGFWSREEREHFRSRAALLGARSQVHALHLSLDELWARLGDRNVARPAGTFRVSRAQLEQWWSVFQPPGADELLLRPAPHESPE
jgi:predicted kinase